MVSESKRASNPNDDGDYAGQVSKGLLEQCGCNMTAEPLYTSASDLQGGGLFPLVCFLAVSRRSQPSKQKPLGTLALEQKS